MATFASLPAAIGAVCPIRGLDGIPFDRTTWTILHVGGTDDGQRAAAQAILDACPEDPRPVRSALGSALRTALKTMPGAPRAAFDVALANESQDTRDWWASRYGDLVPEDAVKLVRICARANPPVDLAALYDAALRS